MLDSFIVVLGVGLASLSALPVVSAQEPKYCTKDEAGNEVCGTESVPGTLPTKAKVAIALVSITVVFLLLATIVCIRRSRKASEQAAQDVAIEASQVDGPPAILAATYTPETGHSRVYSIGPDTGGLSAVPVPLTPAPVVVPPTASEHGVASPRAAQTPAFPSPSVTRSASFNRFPSTNTGQPQTAPAHKANFSDPSYPFNGFGSNSTNNSKPASSSGQQPRSAFVSNGGFPRPLLAGRLKDRIRERPPSISSVTLNSPK